MAYVAQIGLCRRSAVLCTTPGTGEQHLPSTRYKRADIGMSYRLLDNHDGRSNIVFKNIWLGIDCLNLFGINNVNSYYWVTDIAGQQYAVPNYLTGRQINGRVTVEF